MSGEQAEPTCAAALSFFNSEKFTQHFLRECKAVHKRNGEEKLTKAQVLEVLDKLLKVTKPKDLFTTSFDRHATANPTPDFVKQRQAKVKAFHLKKKLGNLKSGMSGKSIKRKALSLAFCSQLSTLLGRNALSYLEMYFFNKCKPQGRPSWLREGGACMGPGALGGFNLLSGEYKTRNAAPTGLADMVRNYELSTIAVKRLKRAIREEVAP